MRHCEGTFKGAANEANRETPKGSPRNQFASLLLCIFTEEKVKSGEISKSSMLKNAENQLL